MYRELRVGVVVPAFNETQMLPRTLATMPGYVDHIFVVDDCSHDDTPQVAARQGDRRVEVIVHATNQGVGAAIVTGYHAALARECDAVAVMAGDGQMDPVDLPGLLDALIDHDAGYVKGDRSAHPAVALTMPPVRYVGTTVLAWATRLSSGIRGLRDTQCGYTIASRALLEALPLDALFPRYGFPNDILNRVGEIGARVVQHPVRPVYAGEQSGLRVHRVIAPISAILAAGLWRRVVRGGRRAAAANGHQATRLLALGAVLAGLLAGAALAPALAQEPVVSDPRVERLRKVVELIETHYFDPVDPSTLIYNATHGMVRALDANSRFMPAQAFRVWRGRIHGNTSQVGIEVLISADGVGMSWVVPGSPADRAGITRDDFLVAVDDTLVERLSAAEIKARLHGEQGTEVRLLIERASGERVDLTLVREIVRPVPVTAERLPGGVLYVRCYAFQDTAAAMVRDALEAAEGDAEGLQGLVLDFRGNLGGLLEQAVAMAELFLPEGRVVVTLERRGAVDKTHETKLPATFSYPMVVLVDGRSASASELFAGAMQDHGRAFIVGEPTYGKGSVQTTYTLDDASGLKITTSLYYTPKHRSIDARGIEPDLEVWGRAGHGVDAQLSEGLAVLHARLARPESAPSDTALPDTPPPDTLPIDTLPIDQPADR